MARGGGVEGFFGFGAGRSKPLRSLMPERPGFCAWQGAAVARKNPARAMAASPKKLVVRFGKDGRIAEYEQRTADPRQRMEESYL